LNDGATLVNYYWVGVNILLTICNLTIKYMKKIYGYIRVSTQKQGEGVSLIEQKSAIEEFVKKNDLYIIRWFEEKVTAAKEGRPAFNEMIKLLTKRKANGVCFHKIDRSSRNYGDWNIINILADAGIDFYSVSDGINLSDEASRLPADILAAMSTHYIRNLRKEVLKGFYGRLKQGFYPLPAPVGYIDMGRGQNKKIDPVYGPLVKKVFELYCSGKYGIIPLTREMDKKGLRNKRGGKVTKNGIARILRNTFYVGMIKIVRTNEIFVGSHKSLITKTLFNKAQKVLKGKTIKKEVKHNFPFRKMIKCKHCNLSIIAERQKGYVYYRCHTKNCPTKTIRQELIQSALQQFYTDISMTEIELNEIKQDIVKFTQENNGSVETTIKKLNFKKSIIDDRLDKLADAVIDGLIDKEVYNRKKQKVIEERIEIQTKIDQLNEDHEGKANQVNQFLELLNSLNIQQNQPNLTDLADIVNFSTSNIFFNGKNVEIQTLPPFTQVIESKKSLYGEPYRDNSRTLEPQNERDLIFQRDDCKDCPWFKYSLCPKSPKKILNGIDSKKLAKSLFYAMYLTHS
jgi:site-specific DNA recombinase